MIQETIDLYSGEILEKALSLFSVSKKDCTDLGGFEAFVYELKRDNENFILKLTHTNRRSVDYIMGELEFVNYLSDNGVTTSHAVPFNTGKLVEEIDDSNNGKFLTYVFEKSSGKKTNYKDWDDSTIQNWGQITGLMNRLAIDFKPSRESYLRQHWDKDEIYAFDSLISDEISEMRSICQNITNQINELPKSKEFYGLIHGDLHQGNFFKGDSCEIYPFDFDDCEYSYFASDIAIPLYYATPGNDEDYGITREEFAENFFVNFLKGYLKEYKTDIFWMEQIQNFLLLRSALLYTIFSSRPFDKAPKDKLERFLKRQKQYLKREEPVINIDFVKLAKQIL